MYPGLPLRHGRRRAAEGPGRRRELEPRTPSSRRSASAARRSSRRAACPRRPRPRTPPSTTCATGCSAATASGSTMGVPSDGSYGIPKDVMYGFPVIVRERRVQDRAGPGDRRVLAHDDGQDAGRARGRARRRRVAAGLSRDEQRSPPGARFRAALAAETPLQVIGAINANHALLAQRAGFRAIYLSGGGVAAGSLGMPDLGISTLEDVLIDVRRITDVCELPLLVDIDTGFGPSAFNIARTVRSLTRPAPPPCHIEDQVGAKRCGHRPGKEIVTRRRDGRSRQGRGRRAHRCGFLPDRAHRRDRGRRRRRRDRARRRAASRPAPTASSPRPPTTSTTYRRFVDAVKVPVLANITEFGQTPLFTARGTARAPASPSLLYPLSALPRHEQGRRERLRDAIRREGHQKASSTRMQTRAELYELHRLPRVRAAASTRCSRRTSEERDNERERNAGRRPEGQEVRRAERHRRRQHRAVHGRPHRQRPALPRLRHQGPGDPVAPSRKSRTCWCTARCRPRRS